MEYQHLQKTALLQPIVSLCLLSFQKQVVRVVWVVFIYLVVDIVNVSLVITIVHSIDRLPVHSGIGHIVDGLKDEGNDCCSEEESRGGEVCSSESQKPDNSTHPR